MSRHQALLLRVGAAVRHARDHRGWSRRRLSEQCGVSERYLAQLETGTGNISLARFADVALSLGTDPAELLRGAIDDRPVIALLGVRGAGKSTVGHALAARRGVPFVELDQRIEASAGLSLDQIFELHGESYYRRVERDVLTALLASRERMVLATGGSLVRDPDTFAMLRSAARTVWLKASAEDHWNRVVEQGDRRPMAENPHAFNELRALLSEREPLYALADVTVETAGRSVTDVVTAVAKSVS
jgi:XRE family aerobic/anaerobic benzoate catabolism transcriptional regulator